MGFFSSILGGVMGTPSSGSSSTGGFSALPPSITGAYGGLGDELQKILKGNYAGAYTPTPLSGGEKSAIDKLYGGFTPTESSIKSDIGMQMNPYDSYVIDEINRQAGGDFSILKQQMDSAGQMGSNRGALGANDIDLSRLNQIGTFKQSQYNTALQNALTTLPGMRQSDATGALGAGTYSRDIDAGTNSAQIKALQELATAMGILPKTEGSQSMSQTGAKEGIGLSGVGSLISAGAALFSDRDLKENIVYVGKENGHKIYEFSYKDDPEKSRFIGVIADEVEETNPSAIGKRNGFKTVDYNQIGVEFREAA